MNRIEKIGGKEFVKMCKGCGRWRFGVTFIGEISENSQ